MYWSNNNSESNSLKQKRRPIRRRKPVPTWLWRAGIGSLLFLFIAIIGISALIIKSKEPTWTNIIASRTEKAVSSATDLQIETTSRPLAAAVPTLTATPTITPIPPTATPMPTLTPTPTYTPTATPTPTLELLVFNDTTIVNIPSVATPESIGVKSSKLSAVRLDYDLNMGDGLVDWPESATPYAVPHTLYVSEGWDGTDDISAVFQLSYNAKFLYIAATVNDDTHIQPRSDKWIGIGEAIELLIDAERVEDISNGVSRDDFQILLSPGDFTTQIPAANFVRQGNRVGRLADIGQVADIQMSAIQVGNGYQLEAGIPWTLLGITPESGKLIGISVSVNDSDAIDNSQIQFKSMRSERGLTDPNSWGELTLE